MNIDIQFSFAKIYSIEKSDIVKGQSFSLISDDTESRKWFVDNDEVLSQKVNGSIAEYTADNIGESTILIMDDNFTTLKKLTIKVVPSLEQATSLGASAGQPENK